MIAPMPASTMAAPIRGRKTIYIVYTVIPLSGYPARRRRKNILSNV